MKRLFYSLIVAAVALLPVACEKETVPNTGDKTGKLYGTWVLDTKNVDYVYNVGGKTNTTTETTDFTGDHFMLKLSDILIAFAQKGSIFTFDIDDVDSTPYTYNANLNQISFREAISLSTGFLPAKFMTLFGTYDVVQLTKDTLVLKQVDEALFNSYSSTRTTVYSYHKLIVDDED